MKFTLVVEDDFNPKKLVLELVDLIVPDDFPPDVVNLPDGTCLVRVGRYPKKGNVYIYKRARVMDMI